MIRRPAPSVAALASVAALVALAACGSARNTFGVHDTTPAHVEPSSTSVLGTWLLATPADSTAFVGATAVELTLEPSQFSIIAAYPTGDAVTLRGDARLGQDGLLTLTPRSGSQRVRAGRLVMSVGRPVSLLASAAGNTLVFAAPQDETLDPSSVWHRKAAAIQAGATAPPAVPPR